MAYKFPGGDVAFCTAIWILVAVVGIWMSITAGHFPWYIAVCVVTGIAGLGMWFQSRSAGYIFGTVNALLTIIGIIGLLTAGFSLTLAARVAGTMYATWIAFHWAATVDD